MKIKSHYIPIMSISDLCHNLYGIIYDMLNGPDGFALARTSAQAYRIFMKHVRNRDIPWFDKYFMAAVDATTMRLCLSCQRLDDLSMRTLLVSICDRAVEYVDVVALLLPLTKNPSNYLFIFAAQRGHAGILRLLLADSRLSPSDHDNMAIRQAALRCKLDAVQILMTDKRVDPSTCNNFALYNARQQKHHAIVKVLLTDSRVRDLDRTMHK
jgi:hypothetical protein